jgi:hypothetical protein
MATPIHGRKGRLYVGLSSDTAAAEPVANLTKWSIDFSVPTIDATVFGDTNEVAVAGLPKAAGTYAGYYDTASSQLYTSATDGLARRFYLYPTNATTTTYWFGTGLFDFSAQGAVDGGVDISGSFTAASSVTKVG